MKNFWELSVSNLTDEEISETLRIKNLVEFERYCCDYGLKEEQRRQWFDDGQLFTTWFSGKAADYLNTEPVKHAPGEKQDPMESHGHKIHNTLVWLNGNKAIAEILCSLTFRTKLGEDWTDLVCECRMHYRVEKRNGNWGIIYMEGIYEKDRLDPVFGDSSFYIPEEELRKHRPINWNMAVRRGKYLGHETNEDAWAGKDRPSTLNRLYNESSQWLFE